MKQPISVVDQSTDLSGRHLYRLVQRYDPPEYVKSASDSELAEPDLDAAAFADPWHRRFPCHTKAAVWISAAYFHDQKEQLDPKEAQAVEDRLTKLARFHGMEEEVSALARKSAAFNSDEPEALDDSFFALVEELPGQEKTRRYPLRDTQEIKQAADFLVQYRNELPFSYRHNMARKILDRAAITGADLGESHDYMQKAAGYGACAAKDVAELLLQRVELSRKGPGRLGETQVEMLKLARVCLEKSSQMRQPGALLRMADVVDTFDRRHDLTRLYRDGLPRAEEVLFSVTGEKMASLVRDNVETTTGRMYQLSDLERVKVADVREWLGDDYAEALTSDGIHVDSEKAASVIKTMPRGDAGVLDQLMAEKGIMPFGETAAAHTVKMAWSELKKAAASRR